MSTALLLNACAAACPVGLYADAACAAMRTKLSRMLNLPFDDIAGEPLCGGIVPEIAGQRQGFARQEALVGAVLDQLTGVNLPRHIAIRIACGSSDRTDLPADADMLLARACSARGWTGPVQVLRMGVAGTVTALAHLAVSGEPGLVITVDTLIHAGLLRQLEQRRILRTSSDSDGVLPGEAAVALACGPGDGPGIRLHGFGNGAATPAERPERADGLAAAVRVSAAATATEERIGFAISTAAGLRSQSMETSIALSRSLHAQRPRLPLLMPAESVGDAGAALTGLAVILAADALRRGWLPGSAGLIIALDGGPERASMLVERIDG